MNLLKKCNFISLALFIWLLTVLYNGIFVNYLSDLILSISNPSWLGFIAHILIQFLIICTSTIITIKYLDLNVKQLLFSIAIMYLLFAVYSPPALYMFVFTGDAILESVNFHHSAIRYCYADNNADCLQKEVCK